MDLLKNSKKIVPFAMIGLMLTNSIAPAYAEWRSLVSLCSGFKYWTPKPLKKISDILIPYF
tara:strand:- start:89 stop:271 length:183 start_codon:yes stop_codon:yes gene_type:complete